MQAVVEARKAQAVYPGDLEVPIMVSAALERMGRSKQAAAIFDTSYGSLREKLASYPSSPYLHNSLAWLSARCGRRLDEALAHARRAVKLEPNNASYLDTLAEVHHRKGNKLEAVRLMKRCVELRPDSTSYRVRLAEFQK